MDPAQAQLMAPMELFDSIWGGEHNHLLCYKLHRMLTGIESPEPWNAGVDALNFDFMAQPPPGQPNQQQFYF